MRALTKEGRFGLHGSNDFQKAGSRNRIVPETLEVRQHPAGPLHAKDILQVEAGVLNLAFQLLRMMKKTRS